MKGSGRGWKLLVWTFALALTAVIAQRWHDSFYSSKSDSDIYLGEIPLRTELELRELQLAPGVQKGQPVDLHSMERQGWKEQSGALVSREHGAFLTLHANRVGQVSSSRLCYRSQLFESGTLVSALVLSLGYPHRIVPTLKGAKLIYFVGQGSQDVLEITCLGRTWSQLVVNRYKLGSTELSKNSR